MEIAVDNGMHGIAGHCFGKIMGGTDYVQIAVEVSDRSSAATSSERIMLEDGIAAPPSTTRLNSQVVVDETLYGIEVAIAP